jgi:hypothetical protein
MLAYRLADGSSHGDLIFNQHNRKYTGHAAYFSQLMKMRQSI